MASGAETAPSTGAAAAARGPPGGTAPLPTPVATAPVAMAPAATPAADPHTGANERTAEGERTLKRRVRPQSASPAAKREAPRRPTSLTQKRGGGDSEASSLPGDWVGGLPGQDCTLGDLRWFVIREVGNMKQTLRGLAKDKPDKADVIKVFDDGALKFVLKDRVDGIIHEKVGVVKNDIDEISNRMNDHCSKAVHEIQALKGKTDKLTDDLNKYADHVDRLIHEKVGVVKNDLDETSNRVNEHCPRRCAKSKR